MARVAVSVELDVTDNAEVRLIRAVIAADAGRIVDPDGLTAQLEGGFLQAASWTLCEEVTFDRNGIRSTDWESYPVLRFDNVPTIEVILLDNPESRSLGAGEAACGPSIAAIANALFDATGLRMRRLPFTPGAIRARALESPA
ncbi:MAG: xanthine dehydrogenase family protein molybdopterin-binding subunit [Chloroflexi bacterium]|nr:xanthine dehydrogenase family protein molybdopterin-binding subunit [Chloroflexota bacterium]